ncbi:MAG: ABC transporter transmembrane domain-containing protein [Burkholderiaceae bacterium]
MSPHSTTGSLRPLINMALQYKGRWLLALVFLALAAASTLMVPLAFRDLIDRGLSQINEPFAWLMGLSVLVALTTAARFYTMSWLGERVVADLRRQVYSRVLLQPPAYFETLQVGEVLSRLTADTTLIQTLVGTSVSMALRSGVMFAGGVSMMLITSPVLASLMVGLLIAVILPVLALGRRVRKVAKASQDRVADTSALAGEMLGAITTVQAFGREGYESKRYEYEVERAFDTARRRIWTRSLLTAVAIVLAFGVIVFVLWMGAREVVANRMTAGELAQFVLYATLTAGSIAALSEVWGDLQRALGATDRLMALLALSTTAAEDSQGKTSSAEPPMPEVSIEFRDVWFAYPSRPEDWVLKGLSFQLAAGQVLALVGPSGAGKTTVFQLLMGFYQPQRGQILINGKAWDDWGAQRIRASIGLVPQDPVVFSDDALNNIRYGDLSASSEQVYRAAKAAHAHAFIEQLPQGYQTFLGERGLRLSGGQRQRMAIARAILRNPPLLLLDEATSALDTLSERAVQEALQELLPGRTAMVIAHRLSTVRQASLIALMDQGELVGLAPHDELIRTSALYQSLAEQQFVDRLETV